MNMSDKYRMFVAQSNDNEYLYQDQSGNLGRILFRYYTKKDAQSAIERAGRTNQCHVVELVEAPAKVVVSEEEAKMLEREKSRLEYPAKIIHRYVYDSHNFSEWDYDREVRLMRAYVNGWTVEKPKRYGVWVPHVKGKMYFKDGRGGDGLDIASADCLNEANQQFTAAEIEHYELTDCEKVVCADSARTTGEVTDDDD